ncbi:MAG: hypothetical protein [Sanya fiers-like virus 12]|nr:MAG: hypothetical protein [Sanya fiers-like virus 12]UUW21253.1 MAG: hypothetical protein [Sanya fiers-like virus 12]
MANIVIPQTTVADTGTGATMVPYKMAGDSALYREQAPTGAAALLQMRRTEAKPTKDYAGAAKAEVKFTRQVTDTQGRLWPAIVTVSSSIPAFLTDSARASFVDEAMRAHSLPESRAALATQVIPQS